jgi:hypothetical protein
VEAKKNLNFPFYADEISSRVDYYQEGEFCIFYAIINQEEREKANYQKNKEIVHLNIIGCQKAKKKWQ